MENALTENGEMKLPAGSDINWLTPENTSFERKNGLLYCRYRGEEKRVTLCRLFPFDLLFEYISVRDAEKDEIGMIRDCAAFGESDRKLLEEELSRRYYMPVVKKILGIKERFGFSYWEVETADGKMHFTMQDTYRNMIRISDRRIILLDADGNRFEIPDVTALDAKSIRKIELYL